MKKQFLAALAALLAGSMSVSVAAQFQEGPPTKPVVAKAQRTPVKTVKVDVPVTQGVRSDTPVFRGEGLFQQHCSVCHLGRFDKSGQVQPVVNLAGVLKDASPDREAAVRMQIQRGSINMPSFQHTFTAREVEALIAYLKTR